MKAAKKVNKNEDGPAKARVVVEDTDGDSEIEQTSPGPAPAPAVKASVPEPTVKANSVLTTQGAIPVVEDLDESLGLSGKTPIPVSVREAENLEIVFLDLLMDFPIVGDFNFQKKFGISHIRKFQKFVVPRDVALHLYDKKLVTIPEMA